MTLGEAIVKAKENMTFNGGVLSLKMPECKKRMNYKELCKYYNDKLFKYWLNCLSDDIPKHKKKQILRYLLGRI